MRKILSLAAMVAVASCGGAAQDDFSKATPSFDSLALDIGAADAVPENFEAPAAGESSGSATLDLDKLAPVTGDAVSGQLTLDFNVTPAEKKVVVTMANFKVNSNPARNGHFVFDKQAGKGGSLKFIDDMVLR